MGGLKNKYLGKYETCHTIIWAFRIQVKGLPTRCQTSLQLATRVQPKLCCYLLAGTVMDAHFSKMLAPAGSSAHPASQITFIAASKFEGRKDGYKFQRGSKGTGYYYDRIQVNNAKNAQQAQKKEEVTVSECSPLAMHDATIPLLSLCAYRSMRWTTRKGNAMEVCTRHT